MMPDERSLPILVVDDYKTTLRILKGLLRQLGFPEIDEATDGARALSMMREKRYGLVISDWDLREMSGLQLLGQMRAEPGLGSIPFIMMTGEGAIESIVDAQAAGVDGCIVKPFSAAALEAKITGALHAA